MVLCYNCFEPLDERTSKCPNCGAIIKEEIAAPTNNELQSGDEAKDYSDELKIIEESSKNKTEDASIKEVQSDLIVVVIMTSILGLLQIYTARIIDSINEVGPIFGVDRIISGTILTISGFIYFFGIISLYTNFHFSRRIYTLLNISHLFILFIASERLAVIRFRLSSEASYDLPVEVQDFISNIGILRFLMIFFGIFYVVQNLYLFKREILNIKVR